MQVTVKVLPVTCHERTEGEQDRSRVLRCSNVGSRRKWVVNATPRLLLSPGKNSGTRWRRLGEPPGQSGRILAKRKI
jgi:hypothetical protein